MLKANAVLTLKNRWYLNRLHDANVSWDYTYQGFWSRFHRRELVWQNEERLGRQGYANGQKAEAFAIYRKCVVKAGVFSENGKRMRKTLKQYKKEILPGLKWKTKIMFYASLYFPFVENMLRRK